MTRPAISVFLAGAALCAAASLGATTLAAIDGKNITDADVRAAAGEVPTGEKLAVVVDGLVERRLILGLARGKGLAAEPEGVKKTAALTAKAYGPNAATADDAFRRYLAEEVVINEYIDLYIIPRVKKDDETVKTWFVDHAEVVVAKPPADRAARAALFARHRNEVFYHYFRREIARLLGEEARAARARADIKLYLENR